MTAMIVQIDPGHRKIVKIPETDAFRTAGDSSF